VFAVRLYEAIGDGGPLTLYLSGSSLYARTEDGQLFDLASPTQPLLMVGEELLLRPVSAKARKRRATARGAAAGRAVRKSGTPSRRRPPAAE
jgi:hypothetical protein